MLNERNMSGTQAVLQKTGALSPVKEAEGGMAKKTSHTSLMNLKGMKGTKSHATLANLPLSSASHTHRLHTQALHHHPHYHHTKLAKKKSASNSNLFHKQQQPSSGSASPPMRALKQIGSKTSILQMLNAR